MPPSPTTRQGRKRKLPTGAGDSAADEGRRHGSDDAGKTPKPKRSRRGRAGGQDAVADDDGGGSRGSLNGSLDGRREARGDGANRTSSSTNGAENGRGASSNGMPPGAPFANVASPSIFDHGPVAAAATEGPASAAENRRTSSVTQRLRRLAQDSTPSDGDLRTGEGRSSNNESVTVTNDAAISCDGTALCNNIPHSNSDAHFREAILAREFREERSTRRLLFLLLLYVALIVCAFSSVLFAQHCDHSLAILEEGARFERAASLQADAIRGEARRHEKTRSELKMVDGDLAASEERAVRLEQDLCHAKKAHEATVKKYESLFRVRDEKLGEALERINKSRGEEGESEVLSDNSKSAETELGDVDGVDVTKIRSRDREVISTVESLAHQLKAVTDERDELNARYGNLLGHSKVMSSKYNWMHRDHVDAVRGETWAHVMTQSTLKTVEGRLAASAGRAARLERELSNAREAHGAKIREYESLFREREEELGNALERIKRLGGEGGSDEVSDDSIRAEREQVAGGDVTKVRMRDRELISMAESLTRQLKTVTDEKDELDARHEDLLSDSKLMLSKYDLLHHNHVEVAAMFARVLAYVRNLQLFSERQRLVILELTTVAQSLRTSLENSRSNLEAQSIASSQAVEAVAHAAGQRTRDHEAEREEYAQRMEDTLERLEEEALGAVNAVAYAAGRLQYERKVEEEERWRGYVAEVETILGGIREEQDRALPHRTYDGEASVLRAAIARRIEEGIASLQGFVRPYNPLSKGHGGGVKLIEGPPVD